jgi:uncharacterized membrane protein
LTAKRKKTVKFWWFLKLQFVRGKEVYQFTNGLIFQVHGCVARFRPVLLAQSAVFEKAASLVDGGSANLFCKRIVFGGVWSGGKVFDALLVVEGSEIFVFEFSPVFRD